MEARSLVQRSAEAAKETKSLIQASVSRWTRAVGAQRRRHHMERSWRRCRKCTTADTGNHHRHHQQSGGIAQVNTAVSWHQMTQQNASLGKNRSPPQKTCEQAMALSESVNCFSWPD